MADVSNPKIQRAIPIVMIIALFSLSPARVQSQDGRPVADAGSSRYAAKDPVLLDGTGSYDPDNSGTLSYTWRQISGPSVVISDANTATPTISGFIQTEEKQECKFELVVSDGELTSLPDTVRVIIVPYFGDYELEIKNNSFDPNKPTIIYFGGGLGGIVGGLSRTWSPFRTTPSNRNAPMDPNWLTRANIIEFPKAWWPDNSNRTDTRTYYRCGDVIIVYLSSVAPNYKQAIQVVGHSAGSQPTMDTALRLNDFYYDPRYNVNRVTYCDCGLRGQNAEYALVEEFVASSVDGEQCWFDSIESGETWFWPNALIVYATFSHGDFKSWYGGSLTNPEANTFNNGVVGGAYWSVVGPGKNLQLATTPGETIYRFRWHGSLTSGRMDFQDESSYPGRLPEPVTLLTYSNTLDPNDEPSDVLLTCKESENAIGYQLLFGPDPYRVMDYNIISDTTSPPAEIITTFPFKEIWWTVRAYDQYGSTIYADPILVSLENLLTMPPIDNLTNGKRYVYIQQAIDYANSGDEILIGPGVYQEDISFRGKNLTLRSTDPNDPAIVMATVIDGHGTKSVVTFSGGEDSNCVLAGFTITGGNAENGGGIYCGDNSTPTITNCIITNNSAILGGGGMYTDNSSPTVLNCIFNGNSANLGGGVYSASGNTTMINCTLAQNTAFWAGGICNFDGSPLLTNCILWDNSDSEIGGIAEAAYSDIRGGWLGEGNIDTDPIFADSENGDYHLKSQAGRWDSISQSWIQDDVTSPCIDAGDPTSSTDLEPSPNGGRINMGAYGGTSEASKSPLTVKYEHP